ncbi:3-dehydroquinate synthase II [Geoglobus acetivorans]|uniref:3-dehydroquinate synthase n=1 Tax=Geoglobus acetivorans TaxID=565033 RepID=A0A0A7GEK9_GEOAI|nr:3-dehydroquinate synthase [Geoglobus acetivorans]
MKEVWLIDNGDSWEDVRDHVIDAIETGFTGVAVRRDFMEFARKLGNIEVEESTIEAISDADDQNRVAEMLEAGKRVFIEFENWKIIPLENLIAMRRKGKIIPVVETPDEAEVVLTTLERGADGFAIRPKSRELMREFAGIVERSEDLSLVEAEIFEIKKLGVGDRVCVDTITLMSPGEGMLVGNSAEFMFLVASESEESEYVASRPFRVNAGSVNAYIRVGSRTRYLAELRAGDEVEIVRFDGKTRKSFVGRVKIEKRPMILLRARFNGVSGSVILQNAETIKLVTPEGKHVSVAELKVGDRVLAYMGEKARHFGMAVEESIIEG